MPPPNAPPWLPRLFWIAAGANVLLVLLPALDEWNHPRGEFSGLVVIGLLTIALCLAVAIAIVALLRKRAAYWIGLALVCIPGLWFVLTGATELAASLSAPSIADQDAGRGYFTAPADRALAEAIVAGDAAKVAERAPAANLNAPGWSGMTFMRLALEHDHPNHDVLAALLHAGLDPDQGASDLYSLIYNEKDEALLRLVVNTGVDLNKHMGKGGWYVFIRYDWPDGLALLLDHGADPEVQDPMGYTPIMRATQAESWTTVDVLLAHGARTDHTGNDRRTLRDLLSAAIAEHRNPIPPRIAALEASLR